MPHGYVVHSHAELPSTNDEARRLAQAGAPHGTVVQAAVQTAGRGRHGRLWVSPAGNLYASFVLRPQTDAPRVHEIGFVAALAVADTVGSLLSPAEQEVPRRIGLKWPNDVLIDGAKVSGILSEWLPGEKAGTEAHYGSIIVGIGMNVQSAPAGLPYPATCLADIGCVQSASQVLATLIAVLASRVDRWQQEGFASVRDEWLLRGPEAGSPMRMTDTGLTGRFAGLASDGALLLDTRDGIRRIVAGDVARR